MATREQMAALMATSCPWCEAQPGQRCTSRFKAKGQGRPPSTLDGETHEARWQKALGMSATVLSSVVEARQSRPDAVSVGSVLTTELKRPVIECPY